MKNPWYQDKKFLEKTTIQRKKVLPYVINFKRCTPNKEKEDQKRTKGKINQSICVYVILGVSIRLLKKYTRLI